MFFGQYLRVGVGWEPIRAMHMEFMLARRALLWQQRLLGKTLHQVWLSPPVLLTSGGSGVTAADCSISR